MHTALGIDSWAALLSFVAGSARWQEGRGRQGSCIPDQFDSPCCFFISFSCHSGRCVAVSWASFIFSRWQRIEVTPQPPWPMQFADDLRWMVPVAMINPSTAIVLRLLHSCSGGCDRGTIQLAEKAFDRSVHAGERHSSEKVTLALGGTPLWFSLSPPRCPVSIWRPSIGFDDFKWSDQFRGGCICGDDWMETTDWAILREGAVLAVLVCVCISAYSFAATICHPPWALMRPIQLPVEQCCSAGAVQLTTAHRNIIHLKSLTPTPGKYWINK